jgi:soluble lytic murein transglycosylase
MAGRAARSRRRWRRSHTFAALLVGAALLLVAASGRWQFARELLAAERVEDHVPAIAAAAREFGLDPYLVAGVVAAESSGRSRAVSSVGALGLMQLRPDTAAERARLLGVRNFDADDLLDDPALNVRLGCAYLDHLFERFGQDPRPVLMAYNAGPNKVAAWFEEAGGFEKWLAEQDAAAPAKPGSVRHYAKKVLATAERYRKRGLFEEEPSPSTPTEAAPASGASAR